MNSSVLAFSAPKLMPLSERLLGNSPVSVRTIRASDLVDLVPLRLVYVVTGATQTKAI